MTLNALAMVFSLRCGEQKMEAGRAGKSSDCFAPQTFKTLRMSWLGAL